MTKNTTAHQYRMHVAQLAGVMRHTMASSRGDERARAEGAIDALDALYDEFSSVGTESPAVIRERARHASALTRYQLELSNAATEMEDTMRALPDNDEHGPERYRLATGAAALQLALDASRELETTE